MRLLAAALITGLSLSSVALAFPAHAESSVGFRAAGNAFNVMTYGQVMPQATGAQIPLMLAWDQSDGLPGTYTFTFQAVMVESGEALPCATQAGTQCVAQVQEPGFIGRRDSFRAAFTATPQALTKGQTVNITGTVIGPDGSSTPVPLLTVVVTPKMNGSASASFNAKKRTLSGLMTIGALANDGSATQVGAPSVANIYRKAKGATAWVKIKSVPLVEGKFAVVTAKKTVPRGTQFRVDFTECGVCNDASVTVPVN